ncbi:outer membrane beta-barrel family protein [Mucilaginibacter panaciglaebae]|uniref:Outer membrane beta-barrel family protein n=1 Tax=Mucilaginibacter panaciglaebae TaxID=502331 RepID=A0ABP7WKT0_9SPHI
MKYFIFVLLCLGPLSGGAQKLDSLNADSSKKESAIRLNTVIIRGQRPLIERRVDGIVFNAESLLPAAGADASDILRKIPMLSVDGNNNLMVRGSAKVKVLIDGKPSEIYAPSVADALRAIRAEQIAKVEVITDPSAKYDAQETDAVINIITKKLKQNITNANIGGVLGNRGENIMGDIHHQQGVWQVHGDGFIQGYRNRNGTVLLRNTAASSLRQKAETRQTGRYIFGGINLICRLDSLNNLNAGFRVGQYTSVVNSVSDTYDTVFLFQRLMKTPVQGSGQTYNVGFDGQSNNKKNEYSLLGMYADQQTNTNYALQQNAPDKSPYQETFAGTVVTKDLTLQADYAHAFSNDGKWESGAKLSSKNVHDINLYAPDAGRSATFNYNNTIFAAYTNLSNHLGSWGWSTGLRYEKTTLNAIFRDAMGGERSFNNWVPYALVQLTLSDNTSLKLSYTQKIVRPFVSYLDPTVNTSDSLTLQHGNPDLSPEITRRYQFSYSVNDPKFFRDLTLFFNDNRNTIENIRNPLANGRLESTWKNVGINQRLGLSATFNWKPGPAFLLGGTLTGQYVHLASKAMDLTHNGFMQLLTMNASYKMPRGYSLNFYGYFNANDLSLQGYRQGWKFYNMTLNKKFRNERLMLSLRAEAFLTRYTYNAEIIATSGYAQRQTTRYQNQNLRLSVTYKIGKSEIKAPATRSVDQ